MTNRRRLVSNKPHMHKDSANPHHCRCAHNKDNHSTACSEANDYSAETEHSISQSHDMSYKTAVESGVMLGWF